MQIRKPQKTNKHIALDVFQSQYGSDFAAKTDEVGLGVSVYEHCLTAGLVAQALLSPKFTRVNTIAWINQYNDKLTAFLPLIIACHDVGKVSAGFQAMIRNLPIAKKPPEIDFVYGSMRHEVMTYNATKDVFGVILAKILLYHHGYYRNESLSADYGINNEGEGWGVARKTLISQLAADLGVKLAEIPKIENLPAPIWKYLAGLVVVCDWIASDERYFAKGLMNFDVISIQKQIDSALVKYGFDLPDLSQFKELEFSELYGFTPNAGQVKMFEEITGPGLYIYEAPMGIGKTEAALYPAMSLYKKGIVNGIYFAMPTQVTSNRIFARLDSAIQKWFGDESSKLLHGTADIFHNPAEDDWFAGNKKALLDKFGAGTVDQLLLSVLPSVKHFFLRTYGLCNKVVIIDEVHSYDVYTSDLLKSLIDDLIEMDCVVILLSATLTEAAKMELMS